MALPAEKISELKQIIHTQLSQMDIQKKISMVVAESMQGEKSLPSGQLSEDRLIDILKERGLMDDIVQKLQFGNGHPVDTTVSPRPATHFINTDDALSTNVITHKASIDPSRRYLYLQVLGGKAFLEHLQESEIPVGQITSTFTLHVFFRGQRFRSRPTPCACEPDMQEGFLLELHKFTSGDAAKMADKIAMMSLCDNVHLVLIKTECSGETSLVSSHFMEWRPVLVAPGSRCNMVLQLMGTGAENRIPVGLLEVRLEIIPNITEPVLEDILTAQINLENGKQAEKERLFLVYAKQWWKEFLQVRSQHRERLVKIFAQDENLNNRPVCSYVKPMRAGRLIDNPRQAARFVSLIGYEKTTNLGGGERSEQWTTMHAFLCRNKGDCEDHAVLLASLLLGFGLDAYICVGTKIKGTSHVWVMTISTEGVITFWESLTGHRYTHQTRDKNDPPELSHPYKTIACIFNHEAFFANIQPTDDIRACAIHLQDESKWKCMSRDAIQSVCADGVMSSWPGLPPLCAPTLDPILISNDLEQELRSLVTEHRQDQGMSTVWDDHLSYLLTPALSAYETERVTGINAGNEEFQQAIRRAVPDGHTFKGYPIQFVHKNARRAFSACLKSKVCEEIVNCRGDHMRLAVRVKVYTYPESACSVWIMFACKYKCVS